VTHRLYYTNSYLCDFEATVTERADDAKRIYLDQTAFYPASGSQPFDTGQLSGVSVVDVVDEGERIAHVLAQPLEGQRVLGRIDWPRRFDHMQQHTGQHLLSAVVAELFGRNTLSVHFGKETSTVDLDGAGLSTADLSLIETRANQVVTENRVVEVEFRDAGAADGLRKPSAREGNLRIVTIRDLDRSACGGTHVRATGEIGPILLGKQERVRSGIRLEFVCGGRAIRRAREDHEVLTRLAAEFTASPAELAGLIHGLRADLKAVQHHSQVLQDELDRRRAAELYSGATLGPDGVRRILFRDASEPLERLKHLGQAIALLPRAIFVGATGQPPRVIVAASKDSGFDAGKTLKRVLADLGGRGGGSATLAQGTVPEAAQLDRAIDSLLQSPET
jgi:alanyl-tRNA synthetase